MARVALIVHSQRPQAVAVASTMGRWLLAHGHGISVPETDTGAFAGLEAEALDGGSKGVDVAVSVGGDGTMLRAVRLVAPSGTPVLGVNVGHLGYLTEVEPDHWENALIRVLNGDYDLDERMTLLVELVRDGGTTTIAETALNDAVVEKLEAGHTVRVGLSIGSRPAMTYAADALIVATPTGSTAYNLSAGGPIVSPRMAGLLVTPVAPHSLFTRSMLVAPDEVVEVEVVARAAVLGVDGRHVGSLRPGDVVRCQPASQPARLITFGERDFFGILKAKFGVSGD